MLIKGGDQFKDYRQRHDECAQCSMKNFIAQLFNLQTLEMEPTPDSTHKTAAIQELRQQIPPPILGHYDRLRSRNRKGVALVRHGVCAECHMRLATGIFAEVVRAEDIVICDTCGRYLHILPQDIATPESQSAQAPPPAAKPAAKRKKSASPPGRKRSAAVPDCSAPA